MNGTQSLPGLDAGIAQGYRIWAITEPLANCACVAWMQRAGA
jgi:hypothetical protein